MIITHIKIITSIKNFKALNYPVYFFYGKSLPDDELQAKEDGVAGDAQSEKGKVLGLFSAKFEPRE